MNSILLYIIELIQKKSLISPYYDLAHIIVALLCIILTLYHTPKIII